MFVDDLVSEVLAVAVVEADRPNPSAPTVAEMLASFVELLDCSREVDWVWVSLVELSIF